MGSHLKNGKFQSDKYPTTPLGKVPLSTKDKMAQDLLWAYAKRYYVVDKEFSSDLAAALLNDGYSPDLKRDPDERIRELLEANNRLVEQKRLLLAFVDPIIIGVDFAEGQAVSVYACSRCHVVASEIQLVKHADDCPARCR